MQQFPEKDECNKTVKYSSF